MMRGIAMRGYNAKLHLFTTTRFYLFSCLPVHLFTCFLFSTFAFLKKTTIKK